MPISLRVLLVEDSPDDAGLLKAELQRGGYDPTLKRVDTASALRESLLEGSWDIIISDFVLPHLNGMEALEMYKSSGLDIPFILMSGMVSEETAIDAMVHGAHDFVMKGRTGRLIPAIQRELREARLRKEKREGEEALERERERSLTILENSPNGIALIDNNGTYQYINREFTNITGYTVTDIPTGRDWFLKAFPDRKYRKNVVKQWKEDTAKQKKEVCKEFTVTCKDGEAKEIEFRTTYLRDYCIVSLNDVTMRKQVEEALRKSEEQYRRIIETTSEGIEAVDESFKIYFANAKMAEMLGYEAHELIGNTIESITFEEDIPALRARLEKRRQGIPEQFERRLRRKDGSAIWIHGSATPIMDEKKGFMGAFTMFTDITQRKEAEQALRLSEEKYRRIFENSIEGIFQTAFDGRYLSVNPSLAKMFGFASPEELMTTFPNITEQYVDSRDREKLLNIYKQKGHAEGFETRFFKKDRGIIWVTINGYAVKDENGVILFNAGFVEDVTKRKLAEDSLRTAITELASKNVELQNAVVALKASEQKMIQQEKMASIGMLSAGIAHEIKNPLGIILQGVEFIESSISDPTLLDVVEAIKKSTLRADKIIKDLLSFARQTPPVFEPLNIVSVVEETLALVEHQMNLNNIQVIRRFSPGLPDIKADSSQLKQVLINVILNAVDAMPKGGEIIVNLLHIDTEKDGQYLYIGITDTGSGIPEDEIRNIFDPFYTTKRETGGSGLGLPVSRGLVERHGGTMTVQSEVGKGTTVTIKIPYH